MQTTPAMQNIEDAVHGAARIPKKAHGSEADTRSPKGKPVVSRREIDGKNQRPLALRGDATSTPMRPLGAHLEANPRNARTAVTPHARPEHAPHSPTSASGAQPNAPQRPAPDKPGERHRGGLGTPLEGTYFQAKLGNAICVQSLDDSLNSAIHITYRISLRSSSLREPRYPSTGVVVRFVGVRATDRSRRPQVGWGGGDRATSARLPPERRELLHSAACPRAPNPHAPPRRRSAREGARRGRPEGRPRPESQFARGSEWIPVMILPQVHLRKPCYDFSFL